MWDYPQEHLVVIKNEKSFSFFEIRNNSTLLLLFVRSPYKYALQGMAFYDKFVDRFRDATFQKNPVVTKGRSNNYLELLRGDILGNMMISHWQDLTWNFLIVWFHKIFKLIFHTCPKTICAENWRKTPSLPAFLENFLYL